MEQDGSVGGGEEWSASVYILKVELTGFADGLAVGGRGTKVVQDDSKFGSFSPREGGVSLAEKGESGSKGLGNSSRCCVRRCFVE